ncbi:MULTISPECIES: hypothetical protein [Aeromonas]|uniref:MarR family transcriptional regulator n=1 Tax=Aeromonas veronii TaxID=654 RepID=A0A4S5CP25_AERVE|nr:MULTISPECIES: hypothetical protein [Aeromonas]THJ44936.1 hypothetical protein E8Q35_12150 [Aeromonas veronii]
MKVNPYNRSLLIMGYLLKVGAASVTDISEKLGFRRTTVASSILVINEQWPDVCISKDHFKYSLTSFPQWLSKDGVIKFTDDFIEQLAQIEHEETQQVLVERQRVLQEKGFLPTRQKLKI